MAFSTNHQTAKCLWILSWLALAWRNWWMLNHHKIGNCNKRCILNLYMLVKNWMVWLATYLAEFNHCENSWLDIA